jgi:hypothetical protein
MIAKMLTTAAMITMASTSFAQTQPGQTTPSVTPSTGAPIVGGPAPAVGGIEERPVAGLSKCENMLAFEREKCLQDERAGTASSSGQPAGAGGSPAPAGTVR